MVGYSTVDEGMRYDGSRLLCEGGVRVGDGGKWWRVGVGDRGGRDS